VVKTTKIFVVEANNKAVLSPMSSKKKRSKSQKKSGSNNKRISSDETKSKKAEEEEKSELSSELVFEDPFGDDFDEEDIVAERLNEIKLDIHDHDEEKEEKQSDSRTPKQPWRPGVDEIPEGEELEYDPSAYVMYHALSTEWPCLSFDIFRDNLGDSRQRVKIYCFEFIVLIFFTVSDDDVCCMRNTS